MRGKRIPARTTQLRYAIGSSRRIASWRGVESDFGRFFVTLLADDLRRLPGFGKYAARALAECGLETHAAGDVDSALGLTHISRIRDVVSPADRVEPRVASR